jgi:hypothetical protein
MSQPPIPPLAALNAQNQQELQSAKMAYRKIRRAIGMAQFDGWTIGIIAGFSFLFGVVCGDWVSTVIGMALVINAWIELQSAQRLRQLDPQAIRRMGLNQLAVAGVIVLYVGWTIALILFGKDELASVSSASAQAGIDPGQIRMLEVGVYLIVLAIGLASTLGMSRYYFTREKYLKAYLEQTPAWIIAMQRSGMMF